MLCSYSERKFRDDIKQNIKLAKIKNQYNTETGQEKSQGTIKIEIRTINYLAEQSKCLE